MAFLAPIAPFLSAIGSVVSMFGAIQSGNAQAAAYNYQAQVARNNAIIQQQNASWAAQIGEQQTFQQGLKTRAIVGAEKTAQAASNIDVNTGSAVDVRSSAEELGQLSALTIRSNAARQVYGYQVQATADTAQAQLDSMAAQQAKQAGLVGGISSLLGGAAGAGSQYAQWQIASGGSGGSTAFDPIGMAMPA